MSYGAAAAGSTAAVYATYAAIAASVAAAAISTVSAVKQSQISSRVAEAQKQSAEVEAESKRQAAEYDERQFRRRAAMLIGKQEAIYGASGFETTSGSPLFQTLDTARQSELEALDIRRTGQIGAGSSLFEAGVRGSLAKSYRGQIPLDVAGGLAQGGRSVLSILDKAWSLLMPKIPTYTAEGRAAIADAPRIPMFPGPDTSALSRSIAGAGETWVDVQDKLDAQRADTELALKVGQLDADLATIKARVFQDPGVENKTEEFMRQSAELQKAYAEDIKSPVVTRAFTAHVGRTYPRALVDVRHDDMKIQGQKQLADINKLADTLSTSAAEAQTLQGRDEAITTYSALVDRAQARGLFDPVQAGDDKIKFRNRVLEKNMDYLARTDRLALWRRDREGMYAEVDPIKRVKILEYARTQEDEEIKRADSNLRKVQSNVEQNWTALANEGLLPESDLEEALRGENPYILPKTARELKAMNDKPLIGGGPSGVDAIMLEYHSGPPTLDRVLKARQGLQSYQLMLNRKDPLLDKAYNELQTDQRSAEGSDRSERAVRAAEIANNVRIGEDDYDAVVRLLLPGMIGQWQKQASASDKAELRNRIRRGEDPKKVVEDLLKRRDQSSKQVPARNKAVIDLVP